MALKYGGAIVVLPVGDVHRMFVRQTYRDWRRTHDRYDARQFATNSALWYTAVSHPRVSVRNKW